MEQHETNLLQEKIDKLENEIANMRNFIDKISADKLALDGMYGQMIQECHKHRSESIQKDAEIYKLKQEIEKLKLSPDHH